MKCNITAREVNIREDFTQEGLAEQAECTDPVNEICCNEKEIIQKQDNMPCSEIAHKGYRYYQIERLQ